MISLSSITTDTRRYSRLRAAGSVNGPLRARLLVRRPPSFCYLLYFMTYFYAPISTIVPGVL